MNNCKQAALGIMISAALFLTSCGGGKPDYKISLKNDVDSASYYMGYFYSKQMVTSGMDKLNTDAIAKGWQDGNNEVKLKDSDEQVNMFMQKYFTAAQARAKEKMELEGEKNIKAGADFLEANKKKAGIVTLPDGLQYRIVKEGKGAKPTKEDLVQVVYHGTTIDGTVFDSSKERGDTATFEVAHLVPGFTEALTMMNEGSVWEVYIPSDLGYGERSPGPQIKANSVLVFEIDLIKILGKAESNEE